MIEQKNTGESLADWRRRNVDMLIENLSNVIRNFNDSHQTSIKFGISPSGIWKSKYDYSGNIRPGGELGSHTSSTFESYNYAYADTRKWVMEGWLDYIMPQLYWKFDHSSAPFADLVKWWADLTEEAGVDLIVGLGFYRYTDNTWTNPNELIEQLRYMSQYDSIIGSSIFSYKTLGSFNQNVVDSIERLSNTYWTSYPGFPWESDIVKVPDPIAQPTFNIVGSVVQGSKYEDSLTINFSSDFDIYYKIDDGEWMLYQNPIVIDEVGTYEVFFKAINDQSIQSLTSSVVVDIISTTCQDGYEYNDGVCSLIEEEDVDPPKTGCFSAISTNSAIFITFALVLGTSLLVIVRKKEKVI
jgi:glycosyl hydrolase family 10